MARLFGRALRVKHCIADCRQSAWLLEEHLLHPWVMVYGLVAPMLLDGPMDGDRFLVYVPQILCKDMKPSYTALMDGLPAQTSTVSESYRDGQRTYALSTAILTTSITSKCPSPC
jgi:hypothetical protein